MEQIFQSEDLETKKYILKKTYKKGDIIYHEDTPCFGVFYIDRGTVKVFTQTSSGRAPILKLASKSDLLGYDFLIGENNYQNSAKALIECDCYFMEAAKFKNLLQRGPQLSSLMMLKIGQDLSLFQHRCVDLMKRNVRERLASYFCYMARYHAEYENNDLRITLQLSREEIASIIGTANETAIRFISEFKTLGLVSEKDRYFYIPDLKKLQALRRLQ